MNTRVRRVGKRWLEFEDVMRQNGLNFSSHKLTDSTADFLMREKLIPVIVRRAKRNRGFLF